MKKKAKTTKKAVTKEEEEDLVELEDDVDEFAINLNDNFKDEIEDFEESWLTEMKAKVSLGLFK